MNDVLINILHRHKEAQKYHLICIPREDFDKSISERESFQRRLEKFLIKNHIIYSKMIEQLNQRSSEESLFKIGSDFLLQLEKISSPNPAKQIDLNQKISHFTSTYF
jgi:hypothetical protein